MAVDASGFAMSFNGTTWSTPANISGSRYLYKVSCTSSTFCVTVAAAGYAVVYTGTWGTATDVDASRARGLELC